LSAWPPAAARICFTAQESAVAKALGCKPFQTR
jgi:hypothetical protein